MLGLTLAGAAAVAGWNAARRIATIRPPAGTPSAAERTPEGGGGGGQPAGHLRLAEPELAVYAQIADLRERMAGCEPHMRRRVPLPRRDRRAVR